MKDLKISKELMSEVLNYEVDTVLGINKNKIDYTCCRDENEGYIDISINLYEFSHKNCKEWALEKGSYINCFYNEFWWDRVEKKYTADIPSRNKSFYADTEIEAIIKACEWILEQNK